MKYSKKFDSLLLIFYLVFFTHLDFFQLFLNSPINWKFQIEFEFYIQSLVCKNVGHSMKIVSLKCYNLQIDVDLLGWWKYCKNRKEKMVKKINSFKMYWIRSFILGWECSKNKKNISSLLLSSRFSSKPPKIGFPTDFCILFLDEKYSKFTE